MKSEYDNENVCNCCGVCCKLFYINLSKEEYLSERFITIFQGENFVEDFKLAKDCGANFLAKNDDNSCIYLKNKKCSIHLSRPNVCRDFFCSTTKEKFKDMNNIIQDFKNKNA